MLCRNPSCQYYDHGGSAGTPCPGCGYLNGHEPNDNTIAQKPVLRSIAPRMRAANTSVAAKDWRYFKVVDRTTPRRVVFLCRASSLADALGLMKRLYRQEGNKFMADTISIGDCGDTLPVGTTHYYKWQGRGDKKRVVRCEVRDVPALK